MSQYSHYDAKTTHKPPSQTECNLFTWWPSTITGRNIRVYLPNFPILLSYSPSETAFIFTENSKKKVNNKKGFLPFFSQLQGSLQLLVTMQGSQLSRSVTASCWCCLKCVTSEITKTPLTLRSIRMSTQGPSENCPCYICRALKHRRIKWCA